MECVARPCRGSGDQTSFKITGNEPETIVIEALISFACHPLSVSALLLECIAGSTEQQGYILVDKFFNKEKR